MSKIADEVSEKSGHRFNLWRLNGLIAQVAAHLATEHRWALLDRLPESATWDETLRSLIRDDADLARHWIQKHFAAGNRRLALRILNRELDDVWEQLAIVALNQGATESEIADSAITEGG
jgi:chromosome segregation and condensation protein ScpB